MKVNGTISNTLPVNTGVPQGSILGPLMFIMFINDLTEVCTCYLFADDCIIEQYGETPELSVKKTNSTLPAVIRWYNNNLIKMNASKTTVMILSNKTITTTQLTPGKNSKMYYYHEISWFIS